MLVKCLVNSYDILTLLMQGGHMKTHAKETKMFFEKKEGEPHNVKCELAHRNKGGETSYVKGKVCLMILLYISIELFCYLNNL